MSAPGSARISSIIASSTHGGVSKASPCRLTTMSASTPAVFNASAVRSVPLTQLSEVKTARAPKLSAKSTIR